MADEQLDQETIDALDKIFNAWLVLHGMVSKGGVIYQTDNKGTIITDAKGTLLTVDVQQFKSLMADSEEGLQAYMATKGVTLTINELDFPE